MMVGYAGAFLLCRSILSVWYTFFYMSVRTYIWSEIFIRSCYATKIKKNQL